MEKSNADKFIEIYNELDVHLRRKLKVDNRPGHSNLLEEFAEENRAFKEYLSDLKLFANLRNAIVHNPMKDTDPIAEPHESIVQKYEGIKNKVLYPPAALSIAVKKSNLLLAKESDYLVDITNEMHDKHFTYIPVVNNNGNIIGVVTESLLFDYFNDAKILDIDDKITIKELRDYIEIDKQPTDYFKFLAIEASKYDACALFENYIQGEKRLGAIFITANGKRTEAILGMITAWDIAKIKFSV